MVDKAHVRYIHIAPAPGNNQPVSVANLLITPPGVPTAIVQTSQPLQLAATATDFFGHALSLAQLAWSSSNTAVATVSATGLVTGVGGGSCTITATLGGVYARLLVTVQDELAFVRANYVGGDGAILSLHSVRGGVTAPAGAVSQWDDLRGAIGFGPSLTKPAGVVTLLGTGPSDWSIKGDGNTGLLRSALVSLFDCSTPKTLVIIATSDVYPLQSRLVAMLEDAAAANGFAVIFNNNDPLNATSAWVPGGITANGRATSTKFRAISVSVSGTTLRVCVPPNAPVTATITAQAAGNRRLSVCGTATGFNADKKFRAVMVRNRFATAADDVVDAQWAHAYHNSPQYGPFLMVGDGDSNTLGQGLADKRAVALANLAERASWTAWDDVNVGVSGAEFRTLGNQSLLDNYATKVRPILQTQTGTGKRVVIAGAGAGGNDIDAGFRTGAQLWADVQSYAALVHADGAKLIVSTILPRNVIGGGQTQGFYNTNRAAFNALVRAAVGTGVFDALADLAANAAFTSDTPNPTYMQVDNLHVNPTGHGVIADLEEVALASV